MSELVLAINRVQLAKQLVGTHGLYPIDFAALDPQDYALLPRAHADCKSPAAISLGNHFPQILGYFQITNPEGQILAYQRKGKEKGLHGKWSIGVGGHVSQEELCNQYSEHGEEYPPIQDLIFMGSQRELEEEINIDMFELEAFAGGTEDFKDQVEHVLVSMNDPTSSVHVGIPVTIELDSYAMESLELDPAEFCNYKWMTVAELKAAEQEFENWSQILIQNM